RIRDRSIPSEQRQPEIQTTDAAQMPARQPLANALNGARQESPAAEIGIPAGRAQPVNGERRRAEPLRD
ncbi:MAG: hypothetical protein AAGI17_09280, partial [Planctomycetota bacterium]